MRRKETKLKAPFPWFGAKSTVAHEVWTRFGDVANYVEPFFGSGAVLLGRPHTPGIETVNDMDGYIVNFWRALQHDPDGVAKWADNPVFENDLHAIHIWLVNQKQDFVAKLEGDPDFFDAKVAGRWAWGICSWIGHGWCSGKGPWQTQEMPDGSRKLVHLGDAGRGVNRQLVHLGNAGQGVNRQLVHLGNAGQGEHGLLEWMRALAERLSRVRVCCGDWSRVCGPTPTFKQGLTGVFFDPPYSAEAGRDEVYTHDDFDVAHDVREWCLANGDNPQLRIALCGYECEGHEPLEAKGWEIFAWKAAGGYASQGDGSNTNNTRERIYFSPHCLKTDVPDLFTQKVK